MSATDPTSAFFESLGRTWLADELFDGVPDSVFFVKDDQGRYIAVNKTLVERCDRQEKRELIGKAAVEIFPAPLGESFTEQDLEVVKTGNPIRGQLELHLYSNGSQGWCLTWKHPVHDQKGRIIGVAGISRDLPNRSELSHDLRAVSDVLRHIDEHLDERLVVADLAALAGLSAYQLDQRIRTLFELSTVQYITRRRIELACHLLERSDESLSFIAIDCGYSDQSAFTRMFQQSVGMPPGAYRKRSKGMA